METGQGVPLPMTDAGYQGGPPPTAVYPAQQPVYQYSQQQPQITQPVSQAAVVQQLPTEAPGHMMCSRCKKTVLSKTKFKYSMCTWVTCGLLGVFLCWPCCFIPFFVTSYQDVEHSCPECHTVLHLHKR
ncbi:LITAF domain-containing protein-like [Limanda limanda]|uniref:LITAF domain-containing protein-like n=1 Tax=Limanda limanda TaxID=27771 RepID=UPI0029C8D9A5|nr:LITAF domain-containing protein-like [Limanda limanda]